MLEMTSLNNWDILQLTSQHSTEIQNEEIEKLFHQSDDPGTFLLNKNQSKMSVIEKYVYDISLFHSKRLNTEWTDTFVEFWWKSEYNSPNFHFDCDEYDRVVNKSAILTVPLVSLVTYFNDSNIPTVVTNINNNSFKTQTIPDNTNLCLSFPEVKTHFFQWGKKHARSMSHR